jgi:tryptophan synthase beta chain
MVARFQSIISEEIKFQLKEHIGRENPDYVIACVGGEVTLQELSPFCR